MIKFKDYPYLKAKTVTLIDGSEEYARNCKLINGSFYRVGDQCVSINRRWYRLPDKRIVFDNRTGKHCFVSPSIVRGVIDFKEGSPVIGDFSLSPTRSCTIEIDGKNYDCMDYSIPEQEGFTEHINDPVWFREEEGRKKIEVYVDSDLASDKKAVNRFNYLVQCLSKEKENSIKQYKFDRNAYNIEESDDFENLKNSYQSTDLKITKVQRKSAKLLGDISFGCEIEVKEGMLQSYYRHQLGVSICKDGSIGYSPEFVTIPLKGAKGLNAVSTLFTHLVKKCRTDFTCSLHFHIGNIRTDREFLVALYILYCNIQQDLHKMLPHYKTDPSGIKDKNYNQFLNQIPDALFNLVKKSSYKEAVDRMYRYIYTWVMEGRHPDENFNRNNRKHVNGNDKWKRHSRYFSLNFMNMFASSRSTIEFRAHNAVLNPDKAINWLFICVAIIKYAEAHSSSIILTNGANIKIETILSQYFINNKTAYSLQVATYLTEYYKHRCEEMHKTRIGIDPLAKFDVENEENYKFVSSTGMTSLI